MGARLFKKFSEMVDGEDRIPIRSIATNKSPMVFGFRNMGLLTKELQEKWKIDLTLCQVHMEKLATVGAERDLNALMKVAYTCVFDALDPEEDLYGGFVGEQDRGALTYLTGLPPERLGSTVIQFKDKRLDVLLFRYRARNFPATLNEEEQTRWKEHVASRIIDGFDGHRSIADLTAAIDLWEQGQPEPANPITRALKDYVHSLKMSFESLAAGEKETIS